MGVIPSVPVVASDIPTHLETLLGTNVSRAAANLPQTTTETIFTVSGGLVGVHMLCGTVTSAIQGITNNVSLQYNPTAGGGPFSITATLNSSGDVVNTLWSMDVNTADALHPSGGYMRASWTPVRNGLWLFSAGDIQLVCDASATGQVKWDIWYVAIESGASIAAA